MIDDDIGAGDVFGVVCCAVGVVLGLVCLCVYLQRILREAFAVSAVSVRSICSACVSSFFFNRVERAGVRPSSRVAIGFGCLACFLSSLASLVSVDSFLVFACVASCVCRRT